MRDLNSTAPMRAVVLCGTRALPDPRTPLAQWNGKHYGNMFSDYIIRNWR